jgi:23S rRNA (cytosine1962-C5)-methyltransferase
MSVPTLKIWLKGRATKALRGGHPWVFETGIERCDRPGKTGDLAVVFDAKRRFVALGLFDESGPIRVRVLHRGKPRPIDAEYFVERIAEAAALRAPLLDGGTDGFRVVHGENDGLPGLVVDRYADTAVIKLYSAAWLAHLDGVVEGVAQATGAVCIVLRLARNVARQTERLDGTLLRGEAPTEPVPFLENGLRFFADPVAGQKTGFFLDQRDNRARVEGLAAGRSVLNVFAYSGGFSLYAARGGATSVVSLDLSAPALADAERHFAANAADPKIAACEHQLMCGDAFELLAEMGRAERRFDLVVIDPPAFAKNAAGVGRALDAYRALTRLGLRVLEPGGRIVLSSCSSRISSPEFVAAAEAEARRVGRPLEVEAVTGHALDHPIGFPEGAYLKAVVATA